MFLNSHFCFLNKLSDSSSPFLGAQGILDDIADPPGLYGLYKSVEDYTELNLTAYAILQDCIFYFTGPYMDCHI